MKIHFARFDKTHTGRTASPIFTPISWGHKGHKGHPDGAPTISALLLHVQLWNKQRSSSASATAPNPAGIVPIRVPVQSSDIFRSLTTQLCRVLPSCRLAAKLQSECEYIWPGKCWATHTNRIQGFRRQVSATDYLPSSKRFGHGRRQLKRAESATKKPVWVGNKKGWVSNYESATKKGLSRQLRTGRETMRGIRKGLVRPQEKIVWPSKKRLSGQLRKGWVGN